VRSDSASNELSPVMRTYARGFFSSGILFLGDSSQDRSELYLQFALADLAISCQKFQFAFLASRKFVFHSLHPDFVLRVKYKYE
jgi:hypothetical protein